MLICARFVVSRRNEELDLAQEALSHHFSASKLVLSDPQTPQIVADALHNFSISVGQRATARAIATRILTNSGNHIGVSTDQAIFRARLTEALVELGKHRQDIVENFNFAVSMGVKAMCYRWPDVRPSVESLLFKQSRPGSKGTIAPEVVAVMPIAVDFAVA